MRTLAPERGTPVAVGLEEELLGRSASAPPILGRLPTPAVGLEEGVIVDDFTPLGFGSLISPDGTDYIVEYRDGVHNQVILWESSKAKDARVGGPLRLPRQELNGWTFQPAVPLLPSKGGVVYPPESVSQTIVNNAANYQQRSEQDFPFQLILQRTYDWFSQVDSPVAWDGLKRYLGREKNVNVSPLTPKSLEALASDWENLANEAWQGVIPFGVRRVEQEGPNKQGYLAISLARIARAMQAAVQSSAELEKQVWRFSGGLEETHFKKMLDSARNISRVPGRYGNYPDETGYQLAYRTRDDLFGLGTHSLQVSTVPYSPYELTIYANGPRAKTAFHIDEKVEQDGKSRSLSIRWGKRPSFNEFRVKGEIRWEDSQVNQPFVRKIQYDPFKRELTLTLDPRVGKIDRQPPLFRASADGGSAQVRVRLEIKPNTPVAAGLEERSSASYKAGVLEILKLLERAASENLQFHDWAVARATLQATQESGLDLGDVADLRGVLRQAHTADLLGALTETGGNPVLLVSVFLENYRRNHQEQNPSQILEQRWAGGASGLEERERFQQAVASFEADYPDFVVSPLFHATRRWSEQEEPTSADPSALASFTFETLALNSHWKNYRYVYHSARPALDRVNKAIEVYAKSLVERFPGGQAALSLSAKFIRTVGQAQGFWSIKGPPGWMGHLDLSLANGTRLFFSPLSQDHLHYPFTIAKSEIPVLRAQFDLETDTLKLVLGNFAGLEEVSDSLAGVREFIRLYGAIQMAKDRLAAIQALVDVSKEISLTDRWQIESNDYRTLQLPPPSEAVNGIRATQVLLDKEKGELYTYTEWGLPSEKKSGLNPVFLDGDGSAPGNTSKKRTRVFRLDAESPFVQKIKNGTLVLLVPSVAGRVTAGLEEGKKFPKAFTQMMADLRKGELAQIEFFGRDGNVRAILTGRLLNPTNIRTHLEKAVAESIPGRRVTIQSSGKTRQVFPMLAPAASLLPPAAGAEEEWREISPRVNLKEGYRLRSPKGGVYRIYRFSPPFCDIQLLDDLGSPMPGKYSSFRRSALDSGWKYKYRPASTGLEEQVDRLLRLVLEEAPDGVVPTIVGKDLLQKMSALRVVLAGHRNQNVFLDDGNLPALLSDLMSTGGGEIRDVVFVGLEEEAKDFEAAAKMAGFMPRLIVADPERPGEFFNLIEKILAQATGMEEAALKTRAEFQALMVGLEEMGSGA